MPPAGCRLGMAERGPHGAGSGTGPRPTDSARSSTPRPDSRCLTGRSGPPDASWIVTERWEALPDRGAAEVRPDLPGFRRRVDLALRTSSRTSSARRCENTSARVSGSAGCSTRDRTGRDLSARPAGRDRSGTPATLSGEDVLPGFVLDLRASCSTERRTDGHRARDPATRRHDRGSASARSGCSMTPEEFDDLPGSSFDERYRYELIRGVLVVTPPPGQRGESTRTSDLGYLLWSAIRRHHPQGSVDRQGPASSRRSTRRPNRRRCDRAIWTGLGRVPDLEKDVPSIVVEFVSGHERDHQPGLRGEAGRISRHRRP